MANLLNNATTNIVVDGDSNSDTSWSGEDNWWTQLGTKLSNDGYADVLGSNFAVSGDTWADLTLRESTTDAAATGDFNVLILACGTNDIRNDGDTGDQVLTSAQNYISSRVSAGVWDRIVPMAIPPISDNATDDGHVDTYNAGIADLTGASFIIDRRLDSELDDSTNSTYFTDVLHYNSTGHDILSDRALVTLEEKLEVISKIVGKTQDKIIGKNSVFVFGGMM